MKVDIPDSVSLFDLKGFALNRGHTLVRTSEGLAMRPIAECQHEIKLPHAGVPTPAPGGDAA